MNCQYESVNCSVAYSAGCVRFFQSANIFELANLIAWKVMRVFRVCVCPFFLFFFFSYTYARGKVWGAILYVSLCVCIYSMYEYVSCVDGATYTTLRSVNH